tara:strand:- start:1128 stop:1445 length:318 start_codon:yes stop_codon:yes gene_type:complete
MVLKEGYHYQIIPDKGDDQAWNVRILAGMFTETVLRYGVIKFNGKGKEKYMSFNFDIVYTPDSELTNDSIELQEFAGNMLEQIMAQGIKEGSVISREIPDVHETN